MSSPKWIQSSARKVLELLEFDEERLDLSGGHLEGPDNDAIREATRSYIESHVRPLLEAIIEGSASRARRHLARYKPVSLETAVQQTRFIGAAVRRDAWTKYRKNDIQLRRREEEHLRESTELRDELRAKFRRMGMNEDQLRRVVDPYLIGQLLTLRKENDRDRRKYQDALDAEQKTKGATLRQVRDVL